MVSEPANPWRKSRAMGIKNPKFLPVLAADRPYSFSSYGGAPVDRPYSFSGYGGGPNRSVVKVPDIVPGKIPNPAPISGKITKSMVRYEAVASDPTAVWRIASATNYKTDMVQHKRGDFQKVMAGMHESLNRIEELVQKLVSSQTRELPDLVPPAEWENEKTRRSEDLKLISLNSTQGTQLRNTPEGNFNSPPNGYSVVVTGWGDDPLPHAVIASPTLNNMNPSHGPEMAKDMERGVSVVADKHACIEEDDLNTLNKQVRHFTGFGNTPMVYPLKPVIEEIQKSAEETKANILDEAQFDLTQLYMVGRAVKRLRCTGLFWKLPPWPDFGAMVCNQIAQHRGYGVLMNFHSVKQYNHSVLDYIDTKMVANWIMGNLTVYLINEKLSIDAIKFTPWKSCELVASMRNGTIRGKIGKEILNELIAKGGSVKPMMEEGGLVQIADPAAIEAIDMKNNICNISVIAHVDHGKSTLTDSLVAAAGTIVQEVAGDISKTDTRVDETKRGITIKFIGISPFYEMTEVSLKSYKIERDGNKMGRCFMELQVEGEEAYQTSSSVIENANVIMASYDDQLPGDAQVYPEKGTVAFFAGLHGWVFTLSNSTKMYAYKFGVDESKVMERLWGENYFDPTTKKRTIRHTGSATCKRGFVQFRDEPIEQILSICMNDQKDKLWPMWRKLGVTMKAEENELRGKTLIKSVMQTWLPVSNILFEMMIFHLTISSKAQNYRVENLYEGSLDDNYATVISHFDLEGSLLLNVSKMIPTSQKGRFLAFSHVFSRKVAIDKYLYVKSVQHPEIWKGKKQEYVEDVPCGDIVAMGGLDQFITKDATLTNEKEVNTCPIRVMKLSVFPVVGVAVQCELVEIYNADIPADSYKTDTSLNIVTAYDFVLVRGTKTLNLAKSVALPSGKYLFDGVVDGHNFWADGLAASLGILQSLESIVGKDKLVMATSRSFMHLVVDLVNEAKLDTESKSWLPFTAQKVAAALKCCDHRRATDSSAKLDAQQKPNIQVLPTTTTGSFPQTVDLRRVRREYKANKIFEEYINAIKEGINKEYISAIKERDIDVFIYGEPERNDRVEYFGEQLRFCVHCQRMGAKTAQSLTFRPMKEMFTSLGFLIKALEGKYAAKGEGMSEPAID